MWFFFALCTVVFWGAADLFYKMGSDKRDTNTHLKIVVMVGLVMGIHGVGYMAYSGTDFVPADMIRYLPVSFFYIASMTFGYFGLRYIELSVASPIQNSSGALVTIMCCIFFIQNLSAPEIFGISIICIGVFMLAVLEKREEDKERLASGVTVDAKQKIGFAAIVFPIIYCVLDAMGTFLDAIYLGEADTETRFEWLSNVLQNFEVMDEDVALLAYEFTFLICGLAAWAFLTFVKKEKFNPLKQKSRGAAAIMETIGQFTYVFAMSGEAVLAAPMVASYSIVSVILSRLILKEKLSRAQYATIVVVMAGIAILGLYDA